MSIIDISDNRTLIAALKRDSQGEIFEAVYKYYYNGLCAYAARYVSREEAEEIVQGTMIWLWENISALIPELSLKSLLFTIVKNRSLDRIAKEKRTIKIREILIERSAHKFNDPNSYLSDELLKMYEDALGNLPDNYRKYFELSRIDGKTHKEIAEELKVSIQTVNYNISQALKILKKDLKDYLPLLILLLKQL